MNVNDLRLWKFVLWCNDINVVHVFKETHTYIMYIQLNLDLTNWLGPTNMFAKSKQFVKLNIDFCKEYGTKISMLNNLRYADMKKEWLLFTMSLKIISYSLEDQL